MKAQMYHLQQYSQNYEEHSNYSQKASNYNHSSFPDSKLQKESTNTQSNASMREFPSINNSFNYDNNQNQFSKSMSMMISGLNKMSLNKIAKNIEMYNILSENITNAIQKLIISGESSNIIIINKLKCSFCKEKKVTLKLSCSHRICKNCFLTKVMDPSHSTYYNLNHIMCMKCKNIPVNANLALDSIITQEEINIECKKNEEKINKFKCIICNNENSRLLTKFYSFECGDTCCLNCIIAYYSTIIKNNLGNPNGLGIACPVNSNHLINKVKILSQLVDYSLQEQITYSFLGKYNANLLIARTCMHCCKCIILFKLNDLTFKCRKCNYVFCVNCFVNHPNKTCQEYKVDKQYEEEKEVNKEKYEELYKINDMRVCPHCKATYHRVSGCNHMTCTQTKKTWCFLCGISFGVNDYGPHWSKFGWSDPACPNFPIKNCPHCSRITSRGDKNNLIKCVGCSKNWCFLCQQIIVDAEPSVHYNGHSSTGETCPNMPLKKCPKCNKERSTFQGKIVIKCNCGIKWWCYICRATITEKELYPHFKQFGDYGIYCENFKKPGMINPEIPFRRENRKIIAKKEIKKF